MPITANSLQNTLYDPVNCTPRLVATPGVGANILKYDPYDQVTHRTTLLTAKIYNINFSKMSGGDTYYLPFLSDGITSVSLPAQPDKTYLEPEYFFTIRLTACAIFIDTYQPAAGAYTFPLGGSDMRPRIIVYHANAAAPYQNAVTTQGINVGANPTFFPSKAMTTLANVHNTALRTYAGTVSPRKVLLKSDYNQAIETETRRLRGQGCTNIQYGATTIVGGFYQPGGWRFYFQTWGAFDYDKGTKQIREASTLASYRVFDCQQFYP